MASIDSLKTEKKFKKTEVGEIPVDWEVIKLKDVSKIVIGQSPSSTEINDQCNGMPFLQGNAEFTSKYPVAKLWCKTPLKIAKAGNILLSIRAPVGDMNIADQSYCIGRCLSSIEFVNVDEEFGWYALQKGFQRSTFEAINKDIIENIQFPLPTFGEQKKIAEILLSIDEAIEKSKEIVEKTKQLKKGLMQELLTPGIGQKKFKKTEIGEIPIIAKILSSVDEQIEKAETNKEKMESIKKGLMQVLLTGKVRVKI